MMCSFYKDKEIYRHHNIMYVHHIDEAVTSDQFDWARRTVKLTWKTFACSPFCGTLQRDGELTFSISSARWHVIYAVYIRDDIKYFVLYSAHINRIYLFCATSVCVSRHRCSFQSGVRCGATGWSLPVPPISRAMWNSTVKFFLQHTISAVRFSKENHFSVNSQTQQQCYFFLSCYMVVKHILMFWAICLS